MQLIAVGLNHTTAPLSLREKVAFPADQLGQAVASACAWFGNAHQQHFENAILSTCNRTEIYGASANDGDIDAV
ncbi:MAG: glutamyl-tRNA reductase, partial [Burkholderiaceae bacterium]